MLISTLEDLTVAKRGQRGLLGYGHASLANTWGYGTSLARAYPQTYPRHPLAGKEVRDTINHLRSAVELLAKEIEPGPCFGLELDNGRSKA